MKVHGFTTKRIRIKTGYQDAGKDGWCFGYLNLDQCWGIVQWDGEEDPDFIKMAGLEEQIVTWGDIK